MRLIDADALAEFYEKEQKWQIANGRFHTTLEAVIHELHSERICPTVNPLPCKMGDTVWGIRYHTGVPYIKQGTVSEMAYLDDMRLAIAVRFAPKYNTRGFWGKDIFASYEECVAEVERRTEDGK